MDTALQVKLLRALQEREVVRVGGSQPIAVDVRLVAATHHDLEAAIASGGFREDLYYRLKGVEIELPPLRDRREDIPHLVRHFAAEFCAKEGIAGAALLARGARALPAPRLPGQRARAAEPGRGRDLARRPRHRRRPGELADRRRSRRRPDPRRSTSTP